MTLWGRLTDGRWSYRITDRDVHWLAVAAYGETRRNRSRADLQAIIWTLAQRFYLVRDRSFFQRGGREFQPDEPRELADLARAYCQPINRYWLTHCGTSDPVRCAQNQAARRRYQSMPWSELPPDVRDYVYRWAVGREPAPRVLAGIVDWVARGWSTTPDHLGPRRIPGTTGNDFFWSRETAGWTEVPVRVDWSLRAVDAVSRVYATT